MEEKKDSAQYPIYYTSKAMGDAEESYLDYENLFSFGRISTKTYTILSSINHHHSHKPTFKASIVALQQISKANQIIFIFL